MATARVVLLADTAQYSAEMDKAAIKAKTVSDEMARAGTVGGGKFGDAMEKGTSRSAKALEGLSNTLAGWGLPTGSIDKFAAKLDEASTKGKRFGAVMAEVGKVSLVGGLAAGVAVIGESISMFDKFNTVQLTLQAAIKNSGNSWTAYKPSVDAAYNSMAHLGFEETDTAKSLQVLTTATNNPTKALNLLSLAANIARMRHMSLADASAMLAKVMGGNTRALAQMGINLDIGSAKLHSIQSAEESLQKAQLSLKTIQDEINTGQITGAKAAGALSAAQLTVADDSQKLKQSQQAIPDILAALEQRTNGVAAAYAQTLPGAIDVAKAEVNKIGVSFGSYLEPLLVHAGNVLLKLAGWFLQCKPAIEAVAGVIAVGLGAAIGAFVGQKVASLINGVQSIISWMGSWRSSATQTAATVETAADEQTATVIAQLTEQGNQWIEFSGQVKLEAANVLASTGQIDTGMAEMATDTDAQITAIKASLASLGPAGEAAAASLGAAEDTMVVDTKAAAVGIEGSLLGTGIGAALVILGLSFGYLATHWKNVLNDMMHWTANLANFVIQHVNVISAGLIVVLGPLGLMIAGILQVVTHFHSAWADMKIIAKGIAQDVTQAFDSMVNAVTGAFAGIWDGMKAGLQDALNGIISGINAAIGAVDSVTGEMRHIPIIGKKLAGWTNIGQIGEISLGGGGASGTDIKGPGWANFGGMTWQKDGKVSLSSPFGTSKAPQAKADNGGNYLTGGPGSNIKLPSTPGSSIPALPGEGGGGAGGGGGSGSTAAAKNVASAAAKAAADAAKVDSKDAAALQKAYLAQQRADTKAMDNSRLAMIADEVYTEKQEAKARTAAEKANLAAALAIQKGYFAQQTADTKAMDNSRLAMIADEEYVAKQAAAAEKAKAEAGTKAAEADEKAGNALAAAYTKQQNLQIKFGAQSNVDQVADEAYVAKQAADAQKAAAKANLDAANALQKAFNKQQSTQNSATYRSMTEQQADIAYVAAQKVKAAAAVTAMSTKGNSELEKLQNAGTSGSITRLREDTTGVAKQNFDKLIASLKDTHNKGFENLATNLEAQWGSDLKDLKQQLADKQEIANADGKKILADQEAKRTQLAADASAKEVQAIQNASQALTDAANAMATSMQAQTQLMSDQFAAQAQAIQDATQAAADTTSAQVTTMADQTQQQVDTLGERGLYGLNLEAQQQQVALDQMKTGFDTQISAAQAAVDNAKSSGDNQSAAAQQAADQAAIAQQAIVNQAQAASDQVVQQTDAAVAAQQKTVDSVTGQQQVLVDQAQKQVDAAATGTAEQQKQAQAALTMAQATQNQAVNQAQAGLQSAQDTANQQQAQAAAALAAAQAQQQEVAAQVAQVLANAQGNASVALAQAQQILGQVQNNASLVEQQGQDVVNILKAQAATEFAGSGVNINVYGLPANDASAIADAVSWVARTQIGVSA